MDGAKFKHFSFVAIIEQLVSAKLKVEVSEAFLCCGLNTIFDFTQALFEVYRQPTYSELIGIGSTTVGNSGCEQLTDLRKLAIGSRVGGEEDCRE